MHQAYNKDIPICDLKLTYMMGSYNKCNELPSIVSSNIGCWAMLLAWMMMCGVGYCWIVGRDTQS